MARWIEALKSWARRLKRDVLALWFAARDARTPLLAKLTAGLVAAYALSPIDLIPDVIPVLGYLDDLLLVPLGVVLAIRMIPPPLMAEFRLRATERSERPRSYVAAAAIVLCWLACAAALAYALWRAAPLAGAWVASP